MPDCKADVTTAQESAIDGALRRSPHVVKVVYVSKSAAMQRFKKENPGLPTKQLPANPLPDEWVLTVDSDQNAAKVGKAICAAHYPGVEPCHSADRGGVQWMSTLGLPLR
jgi:cell division protein FtsX